MDNYFGDLDHTTYDKYYFTNICHSLVSSVTNVNGETFHVLTIGSIRVTSALNFIIFYMI